MMMLPTSCDSSSRRRNSRSFAYTELVILMVVLGFTLADGIIVAGSVTDAIALGSMPKNNPLLLIAPSSVLPNSALKEGGIKHDRYKRKGIK